MILAAQPDFRVVAEVSNGREAVEQGEKLQPALCVMDVSMPDLNGIEATRRLLKVSPRTRVVAVSMHKDSVYVREILRAGAKGYVLKDSSESEFLKAVRAVSLGKGYLSPDIADAVLADEHGVVQLAVRQAAAHHRRNRLSDVIIGQHISARVDQHAGAVDGAAVAADADDCRADLGDDGGPVGLRLTDGVSGLADLNGDEKQECD